EVACAPLIEAGTFSNVGNCTSSSGENGVSTTFSFTWSGISRRLLGEEEEVGDLQQLSQEHKGTSGKMNKKGKDIKGKKGKQQDPPPSATRRQLAQTTASATTVFTIIAPQASANSILTSFQAATND
ncbi:unnamed protein product, partial [Amoebophrya sp. A120]